MTGVNLDATVPGWSDEDEAILDGIDLRKYNADEPRDDRGEWTAEGGGAVYHGTSVAAADKILRGGIKAWDFGVYGRLAFVSSDVNEAVRFGASHRDEKGDFAVLEVRVPKDQAARFRESGFGDSRTALTLDKRIPREWIAGYDVYRGETVVRHVDSKYFQKGDTETFYLVVAPGVAKSLAALALEKHNFNPDEPRVQGGPEHGQWTAAGGGTPYDTDEVRAARAENALMARTSEIKTLERERLRESIQERLSRNGGLWNPKERLPAGRPIASERRADIVLGPPAAGKSTQFVEPLALEHHALIVDADEAKEGLPEFGGGRYASVVHQESSDIADSLEAIARRRGDNIVLPLVGKNTERIMRKVRALRADGYHVHVTLNELPLDKAIGRALTRFHERGRFVDPAYISSIGHRPAETYAKLRAEGLVDSHRRYSNDVPEGSKPVRVAD